jgi:hypothetical protein
LSLPQRIADDARRGRACRRRVDALLQPWLLAAMACSGSYGLLRALGFGAYRSEFLGASLALGVLGGILLLAFRIFNRPIWLHSLGQFGLNWLFMAYAISFLAV